MRRKLLCCGSAIYFAAAGFAAPVPVSGAHPERRPSVVLVILDSVRADHTSPYGYSPSATPALGKLAEQSFVFENAHADSNWTGSSFASILTGKRPFSHGLIDRFDGLPKDALTIQSVLSRNGYETAAFFTGLPGEQQYGLSRGFSRFLATGASYPLSMQVSDALMWQKNLPPEKDFFMLIHGNDAHFPYDCSENSLLKTGGFSTVDGDFIRYYNNFPGWDLRELDPAKWKMALSYRGNPAFLSAVSAAYDTCISREDNDIASLLGGLGTAGGRPLLIIITADHGDLFGEHGLLGHGQIVSEPLVRVPLLIRFPDGRGARRVRNLAEHVDLLPTVCGAAGIACPAGLDGKDLSSSGGKAAGSLKWAAAGGWDWNDTAFSDNGKKIMQSVAKWELYDLPSDPGEIKNISKDRPAEFLKAASGYLSFSGAGKLLDSPPLSEESEESCAMNFQLTPRKGLWGVTPCERARVEASLLARAGDFDGASAKLRNSSCAPAAVLADEETLKLIRQTPYQVNFTARKGYLFSTIRGKWKMKKDGFSAVYTEKNGLVCETIKGSPAAGPGCIPPAAALLNCVEKYRFPLRKAGTPDPALKRIFRAAGYF